MQFWPPDDERTWSKHVETYNKLIVKQKFCTSSWLITEINTQFIFNNVSPPPQKKLCLLWDNAEKHGWPGQATDDNMAHAHCTLDTKGYKNTLTVRKTYCFSTATMVARTRLSVMYIACLVTVYNVITSTQCFWYSNQSTRWMTEEGRLYSQKGQEIFLFCKASTPALMFFIRGSSFWECNWPLNCP